MGIKGSSMPNTFLKLFIKYLTFQEILKYVYANSFLKKTHNFKHALERLSNVNDVHVCMTNPTCSFY